MRIRAIDDEKDWLFGKGQNDYLRNRKATIQNIETRLRATLGECFFNLTAGIDWLNLLGGKDQTAISLAVSAVILNTQDVTGIKLLTMTLDVERRLTIQYVAETTFGQVSNQFQYDLNGIG